MPRSKLDNFVQLLTAARNGSTRTQIASQAGIQQKLVDDALSLLTDLNLLTRTGEGQVSFVTTKRGSQFLLDYQHLKKELMSERNAVKDR